jgi:hypothetical protein
MNKTFKVERGGKQAWVVIRQMAHDTQYKVGSRIPGYGKVVEVKTSTSHADVQPLSVERDRDTMRDLSEWLDSHVHGDTIRDQVREAMMSVYDSDPKYWMSQSWINLFDRAKCDRILAANAGLRWPNGLQNY